LAPVEVSAVLVVLVELAAVLEGLAMRHTLSWPVSLSMLLELSF
jgi:hypothetical protein